MPDTRASSTGDRPETVGRVELELPETFHRLKRTLVLLSGALVLLGCTTVPVAEAVGLLADSTASGLAPTNVTLRACLLVGATYYLIGFLLETRAAHRANADLLDPAGLQGFEAQISAFARRTEDQIKSFEAVHGTFEPRANAAVAELEAAAAEVRADPFTSLVSSVPAFREAKKMALTSPNPPIHEKLEHEWSAHSRSVLQQRVDAAEVRAQRAAGHMNALQEDFRRLLEQTKHLVIVAERAASRMKLNRSVYRDRAFSFWAWDVGGAVVTYAAALLFTVTPVGFTISDALTLLVSR